MNLRENPCQTAIPYWPKSFNFFDTNLPLVSCVMPTANRQQFISKALKYFIDQDYPYKELIIVDDGKISVFNLIPQQYNIRYFYSNISSLLGTKRNFACNKAAGSIIIHWDDDDWYGPGWITHQVSTLLNSEADLCGLNYVQLYSTNFNKLYTRDSRWLYGATLAYRKSFWKENPFKNIQMWEDIFFVRSQNAKVVTSTFFKGFLGIVHSTNTRLKDS